MSSVIPKEPAARVAMIVLTLAGIVSGAGVERYSGKPIDRVVLREAVSQALADSPTIRAIQSVPGTHPADVVDAVRAAQERAAGADPSASDDVRAAQVRAWQQKGGR